MKQPVSVSRRIDAPADVLFGIIADPARHQEIDGSGMLRGADGGPRPVSANGDSFTMRMHNDFMGDYVTRNRVTEYEPGHRIAWEPSLAEASREEDQNMVGQRLGVRWGYELRPDGAASVVTETYDCSEAPQQIRDSVKDGERWIPAMTESLEKLERLAVPRQRRR